jgi:hypothetical protein
MVVDLVGEDSPELGTVRPVLGARRHRRPRDEGDLVVGCSARQPVEDERFVPVRQGASVRRRHRSSPQIDGNRVRPRNHVGPIGERRGSSPAARACRVARIVAIPIEHRNDVLGIAGHRLRAAAARGAGLRRGHGRGAAARAPCERKDARGRVSHQNAVAHLSPSDHRAACHGIRFQQIALRALGRT